MLGMPFLQSVNPIIDWPTQRLQWRSPGSAEAHIGALTADQDSAAVADEGNGGVTVGERTRNEINVSSIAVVGYDEFEKLCNTII